jgi:hypothetical protein
VGFSIAFTSMAKQANLDEHVKGNVLSAFYWGYGVSQVGSRQHQQLGSSSETEQQHLRPALLSTHIAYALFF